MRYFLALVLLVTLAGCSAAGGPDGDRDRWLLPLIFSFLFTAMFKFAEVVINWWRSRHDKPTV